MVVKFISRNCSRMKAVFFILVLVLKEGKGRDVWCLTSDANNRVDNHFWDPEHLYPVVSVVYTDVDSITQCVIEMLEPCERPRLSFWAVLHIFPEDYPGCQDDKVDGIVCICEGRLCNANISYSLMRWKGTHIQNRTVHQCVLKLLEKSSEVINIMMDDSFPRGDRLREKVIDDADFDDPVPQGDTNDNSTDENSMTDNSTTVGSVSIIAILRLIGINPTTADRSYYKTRLISIILILVAILLFIVFIPATVLHRFLEARKKKKRNWQSVIGEDGGKLRIEPIDGGKIDGGMKGTKTAYGRGELYARRLM